MNKKPVFDAVRKMLGRGFTPAEVDVLDQALDWAASVHRLGALSERYESGGRGPGAISGGQGDPGGVSYGTYQLASKTGTVAAFAKTEGACWARDFGSAQPGSGGFSAAWKAIAVREPEAFAEAQHAFIQRTHYLPAVTLVCKRTGLDLDARHDAVRDAVWSVSVQHGGAASILVPAVAEADAAHARADAAYDRCLVEAIYRQRSAYVLKVAGGAGLSPAERKTLTGLTRNRYPAELAAALAMFA